MKLRVVALVFIGILLFVSALIAYLLMAELI